jgi:hypothetical protein
MKNAAQRAAYSQLVRWPESKTGQQELLFSTQFSRSRPVEKRLEIQLK